MISSGHIGLVASDAGFVVHEEKQWLGASPDAWVVDPSVPDQGGTAEFKCPNREANMTLEEACQGSDFCCSMVDGKIHLKENHFYYHQVQLQLYVAATSCYWCDFCVYTTKDVRVERIYPDDNWMSHNCPKLDEYYFDHILPEIVTKTQTKLLLLILIYTKVLESYSVRYKQKTNDLQYQLGLPVMI